MSRALYGWGASASAIATRSLVAWLALMVAIVAIANAVGKQTSNNLTLPGTGSTQAQDLLHDNLPNQANGTNPVVMEAAHGTLDAGANAKAVKATVKSLKKAPHVIEAVSPLSSEGAGALSKDKRIGYISVTLDQSSRRPHRGRGERDHRRRGAGDATRASRSRPAATWARRSPSRRPSRARWSGIAAAVIILLFTFGTATAMALPIATAIVGLVIGLSAIGLLGHGIDVPTVGPTLGTMLGLGVGIDYALFIVTRHRGFIEQGHPVEEAAARAVATAGGAVVFAGGTVVIALCSLAVARIPIVSALGYSAAVVVLIAVITAITLLPALLAILGTRIDALRVPFLRPPAHDRPPARLGAVGPRRRQAPVAGDAARASRILLVLAIPVLNLQLGQQDNGQLPKSTTDPAGLRPAHQGLRPGHQRAVPDRGRLRRQPGAHRQQAAQPGRQQQQTAGSSRRSSRPRSSSRPRACRPTRRSRRPSSR